jgi:hypothetical protein
MYVQVFEINLILWVFLSDFVCTCVLSSTCYMPSTLLDFIVKFDDVYHS